MSVLRIENLHVSVQEKEILKGVNLTVSEGETLALLGPNGHGKSTLLAAIMGNPNFTVTEGHVYLDDVDLLSLSVDQRSKAGVFLAMQYPSEIPGVNSADFLKAAMNAHREKPMSLFQFYSSLQNAYKEMGIPFEMSNRNLNEGFSGGEKKRNEILQMKLLDPQFALLQAKGRGFLVVSHYARLYDMIHPTRAAVLINGRIAVTGGPELVQKIDTKGYEWIREEYGINVDKEEQPMNKVSIGVCATKEIIKNGK